MRRDEVIRILRQNEPALRARGVEHLALFGSIARDEGRPDSDIDVVVEITSGRGFSLIEQAGLRLYVSDLFGREADVVIRQDLRQRFRARIVGDEVAVF
jgi:uncharacterized protein